ncbi:MAG TPA: lytic transglycosylase domain-containing protein [bacterium]|nr:lytic transglycosylase domain-containing protein [bacterium]
MRPAVVLVLLASVSAASVVVPAGAYAKDRVTRDEDGEPITVAGQVYVVKDEDGNLVFTDTPAFGAIPVNLREPPPINPNLNFAEQEGKFDALIVKAAQKYRVDPFLVKAVIRTESAFDPDAISSAGAQGLMQLIPATAERFHVDDLMDPAKNIEGGVRYLRWLLDTFKGDARLAVAAYNCGEALVIHEKKVPDIPETQDYVVKVEAARSQYRSKGFSAGTAPVRKAQGPAAATTVLTRR